MQDVPEDVRKLIPDVTPELVNANWDVFSHCVHFITKKRIAENEEAAAKAREKREAKMKESLSSGTPGSISGQKIDQLQLTLASQWSSVTAPRAPRWSARPTGCPPK